MSAWEYTVTPLLLHQEARILNNWGLEGWELVAVQQGPQGGLIAFLLVLATTYVVKRFTHDQATRAIVVSYYWHFVDVVWIALFFMIYILK